MRPSHNPFRVSAISQQRYKILAHAFNELLQRIERQQFRACIRGPHGTGKSTLLEDVAKVLQAQGRTVNWYYLNLQMLRKQRFAVLKKLLNAHPEHINCLDGGETIGYLPWVIFCFLLKLKQKKLLATTHLLSPLTTVFKTQIDQNTAIEIAEQLAGEYWSVELKQHALEAFSLHRGNCREVFRVCYYYCQQTVELEPAID